MHPETNCKDSDLTSPLPTTSSHSPSLSLEQNLPLPIDSSTPLEVQLDIFCKENADDQNLGVSYLGLLSENRRLLMSNHDLKNRLENECRKNIDEKDEMRHQSNQQLKQVREKAQEFIADELLEHQRDRDEWKLEYEQVVRLLRQFESSNGNAIIDVNILTSDSDINDEIGQLRLENERLKRQNEQFESLQPPDGQLERENEQIAILKHESEILHKENERIDALLNNTQLELNTKAQLMEELILNNRNLIVQVQGLDREKIKLERKLSDLQLNMENKVLKDQELDEIKNKLIDMKAEMQRKTEQVSDLNIALKSTKTQCQQHKEDADHFRSLVNSMTLGQNQSQIKAENHQLRVERDQLLCQVEAVQDVHSAFEKLNLELEKKRQQVEDLEQTLDLTIGEKTQLEKQRQTLQDNLRVSNEQFKRLQSDSECFKENAEIQYQEEIQKFKLQLFEKDEQISRIPDDKFVKENADLKLKVADLSKQVGKEADLRQKLDNSEETCTGIKEMANKIETERNADRRKIDTLNNTLSRQNGRICTILNERRQLTEEIAQMKLHLTDIETVNKILVEQATETINNLRKAFEEEKSAVLRNEETIRIRNREIENLRRRLVEESEDLHQVSRMVGTRTDKLKEVQVQLHALKTKQLAWRRIVHVYGHKLTRLELCNRSYFETEQYLKQRMATIVDPEARLLLEASHRRRNYESQLSTQSRVRKRWTKLVIVLTTIRRFRKLSGHDNPLRSSSPMSTGNLQNCYSNILGAITPIPHV